ncbi:thiopeptide-type bacteriocin biosynthesis protein [Actinomadura soli]|uniref:thiopeptide-type bacteriocin biosynthesis protein n=1 Tax=Actinomadura soli TaxID=2508997 RepID=UPI0014866895|nr:thiopeptide-type bacteriocin biosynthesis protein [Actinomadura soli]
MSDTRKKAQAPPAAARGSADSTAGRRAAYTVGLDGRSLDVADLLDACAESLRAANQPEGELGRLCDAFLGGGLPALRASAGPSTWIQTGLMPGVRSGRRLYARLDETARELLDRPEVNGFFFTHKPPGLRVRVETTGAARAALAAELRERFGGWRAEGLIAAAVPAVYEAEAHLFGGPVSMRSVHRLFAADSLVWLGVHAMPYVSPGRKWTLSLVMLRSLFEALRVEGWEARDVWDRVRTQTYRRLPPLLLDDASFTRAAQGIQDAWTRPDAVLERLPVGARELLARHDDAVRREVDRWRSEYFDTADAYVGPREAAAFYIVLHWNRAAMPMVRQSLLAESLARPEPLP